VTRPNIRICALADCGLTFDVPGDRDPRGNPRYCSETCARLDGKRRNNAWRYQAVHELIRRHQAEYQQIRKQIRTAGKERA
jgi:hypothetical protein